MTTDVLTTTLPAVTRDIVEHISSRRAEPSWLADARFEALGLYDTMDLPDAGDEEWRRTDVRAVSLEGLRPLSASPAAASAEALPELIRAALAGTDAFGGRVVQQDSDVVFTQLSEDLRAQGVIFTDLHTAAKDHADLLRTRLGTVITSGEWKYLALNAALWSGGCFLYIPKDVQITLPLHFVQAMTSDGIAVFPRTLIIAERNSRVAFVDETLSADGARAFVSGAVEVIVGDGAKVEYYSVNRWGDGVDNFTTVRAICGRDASFTGMAAGIGSKLTKMRMDSEMAMAGSSTKLLGVTFGSGTQHFDYSTLQNHTGQHTISDLQFKSALTDSASLVWYGITRINPTAGGSEANQTSRNLLLSEHAKAAPIPILEIEAYDVAKCSHGATAGPVDENELFYLQSHAIPRDAAERMLVEGFFADVIDRVPNEDLRSRVMDAVLEKIGGSAGALTFDEVLSA